MPEYLHPGVFIEETSFRSPPFEGVSTSTAGLVGRTRKGREGRPTLVTSFTEFVRRFGEPFPITANPPPQLGDYLGHAVRAFFDNGGKRAYIVRTLSATAKTADATIDQGLAYLLPATTTVRGPTVTIPLVTTRGLEVTQSLQIWSRAPDGTETLRSTHVIDDVDPARNTVTLAAPGLAAGVTLSPASTFFRIQGLAPATGMGPVFEALSRGLGGNDLSVQIRPSDAPAVRLTPRRFFRAQLPIATFPGAPGPVGPGPGTSMNLDAISIGRVFPGDTLEVSGATPERVTVDTTTSLATADVDSTGPFTAGSANPNDIVAITKRDGVSSSPAVPVYKLRTGETVSLAAGDIAIKLPPGAAVALHPGDEVTIGPIAFKVGAAAPTFTAPANDVTLDGPGLTSAHPASTVSFVSAEAIAGVAQRIAVADVQGLVIPYPTSPQKIAITDGTTTVVADVLLVDGTSNTLFLDPAVVIPPNWTSFELLQVATAGNDTIAVASTSSFYTGAIVELTNGSTDVKEQLVITSVDPGTRTIKVTPTPAIDVNVPADPATRDAYLRTLEIDVLIFERATLVETFAGLSWNPDPAADSRRRYYVDRINDPDNGSELVKVTEPAIALPADLTTQPTTSNGFPQKFDHGNDGGALTEIDLIGHDDGPNKRFGIEALKERKDIALVAVPGVTSEAVQAALLTHCELLKYRFAILDGKRGESDITQIQAHRNNYDSKYGGYYAPWLQTVDFTNTTALTTILTPPSGYVLGICARVDTERGVHKAPANEVVRNILGVELPFTDGEQDVLNPIGVNLIREFEGRGIRVWGARTTTSDQEWKYVNVRRLFIFLEHSIDNGTQWVVFEPNNEALWERVKESIESFLFGVWKSGALMGTKPEEAYFVRCDRTTMTQDDIDNGRLVCLIGVAPAYPAEFVIFRIGQFTASTNRA